MPSLLLEGGCQSRTYQNNVLPYHTDGETYIWVTIIWYQKLACANLRVFPNCALVNVRIAVRASALISIKRRATVTDKILKTTITIISSIGVNPLLIISENLIVTQNSNLNPPKHFSKKTHNYLILMIIEINKESKNSKIAPCSFQKIYVDSVHQHDVHFDNRINFCPNYQSSWSHDLIEYYLRGVFYVHISLEILWGG